jgi:hypothetical protein
MWKLVKIEDLEGRDCRSIYETVDSQTNMCGFRIKMTCTCAETGQMASFFITVTGISEKELPSYNSAGMRWTLRTNFEREYAALGSAMTIQPTHVDALQDFIFSALEIPSKSATAANIRWGFLLAGFIDDNKSFSFPE